jgi:diacylglycerol kinase family enzyme
MPPAKKTPAKSPAKRIRLASHAPNSKTYQVQYVKISAKDPRQVHADARVFGTTPVEYKIVPNALNVICGCPKTSEDTALERRTYLDP